MKVAIIDDEAKARSLIKNLLSQYCSDFVDEIYEAGNLADGVKIIKENDIKLVLLDIEMPEQQGIEIFNHFNKEEVNFELVFTTAFSEYAITAFEMNAIDYLLKPIRPKRLREVVERVHENFNKQDIQQRLEELRTSLKNNEFQKIGLPVKDGIRFVPIKSIIQIEADGMYTNVFLEGKDKLVVSKPLKFFEHLLEKGKTFYRPHRSHIINMSYLKQYVRREGNYIILENGAIVPVSKDKRDEFLHIVSSI